MSQLTPGAGNLFKSKSILTVIGFPIFPRLQEFSTMLELMRHILPGTRRRRALVLRTLACLLTGCLFSPATQAESGGAPQTAQQ
ncbi:MAG: hypothetical protein WCA24_08210, partial [Thiomonas sp.]